MKYTTLFLVAFAITISEPARACNSEGWELPWDYDKASEVVVGRISNYRLVPNEAEGVRLKQAIESGTANIYQKQRYEQNLARGLPPGGNIGLFELTVTEVIKGRSARKITVIFPYDEWANQGPGDHSMLPASMPNQDVIMGLSTKPTSYYGDLNLPRLITDSCEGVMLQKLNGENRAAILQATRKYLGSKQKL